MRLEQPTTITTETQATPPKVSVCVVTYNQERYIRQCLQSIIDQKTNFDFEVIVSDDCSHDGTSAIVCDFAEKHPDIFKVFLHKKNIGALSNFKFTHDQARGKYIAHIDGDDYFLPGKLQIQSDFLDSNPECNITFHKVDYLTGNTYKASSPLPQPILNKKFFRKDLIELVTIGANSSKMYRSYLRQLPLPDFELVDYCANVIQIDKGYAKYCSDKSLGVYRKGIGISGSNRVLIAVHNSLTYFLEEYKELRSSISVAALSWLLYSIKHRKKTTHLFLMILLRTISANTIPDYIKQRKTKKMVAGT